MNLLMIAVIQQNKKVIGFRMFDTDTKEKKFMDVPTDNVKQVLESGKAEVANLGIFEGAVTGTNGTFERYPKIATNGVLLSEVSPLVIVNQLGDVGYTVVDYKGNLKKARTSDVVDYAKKFGISNGKVVLKDNVEFISSITGKYPVEKVAASKVKNNDDSVKIHIAVSNGGRPSDTVSKHAHVDVEIEIEENDVFSAMDESQKSVIKSYYVWYTVDKYKSLAKNVRLNLAVGKAEQLSELRGITDWEFGGISDSGYMGGSKCALKHSLRYEYYAVPADDRDNPDARIVFGETCASDFFHINPEDMARLVKTRTIMSDEIKLMADILANGQERLYVGKAELLYAMLRKLSTKEKIVGVFGEKVGSTLVQFIMTKLPFPMSLVLEASKQVSKNVPDLFNKLFPEYRIALREVFAKKNSAYLISGGEEYLKFMGTNKIEGDYAYNPLDESIKRRDIGAYNKTTRYVRERLLSSLRGKVMARDFNFDELDALLYSLNQLIQMRECVVGKFNGTEFASNKFRLARLAKEYAEENGLTDDVRVGRLAIYNGLMTSDDYTQYNSKPLYYDKDKDYTSNHRYIKYLRDDLKQVDGKFNVLVDTFYNVCMGAEVEKEKARKDEEDRLEKERAAQLVLDNQRKEADRLKKEQDDKVKEAAKKAEADKNAKEAADDNNSKLKGLLESHPEVHSDYGIETAKSIIDSGKSYKELSPKQKWRIDDTIKRVETIIGGKATTDEVKDDNKSYDLNEHPDIKERVQRILTKADDVEMKEALKVEPNVLKIAYTIIKYNRASDKQLIHINKAIEIIDQA